LQIAKVPLGDMPTGLNRSHVVNVAAGAVAVNRATLECASERRFAELAEFPKSATSDPRQAADVVAENRQACESDQSPILVASELPRPGLMSQLGLTAFESIVIGGRHRLLGFGELHSESEQLRRVFQALALHG
jgi:hypothetical protein